MVEPIWLISFDVALATKRKEPNTIHLDGNRYKQDG